MTTNIALGALVIFLSRLADVTIGTLRISMLVRGYRAIATGLSFVEALLWLFATSKAIQGVDDPLKFLAFGAGFASGTLLGSTIDGWLALGSCVVRIIAPVESPQVAEALRKLDLEVTVLNASGAKGEMRLIYSIIFKRRQQEVLETISAVNPDAIVSIDDVTTADLHSYKAPKRARFLSLVRS
ncbi:MAG: DUF5698 domain-containing protein [Cyanobacteria bacterium P01_A01_bin.135]